MGTTEVQFDPILAESSHQPEDFVRIKYFMPGVS